ncbi:MAG: hypothetical protein WDO15_14635 [Bacteroidota bacterium]
MRLLVLAVSLLAFSHTYAQVGNDMDDESKLMPKQNRLTSSSVDSMVRKTRRVTVTTHGDKKYQDSKLRKKYLAMLFDGGNTSFSNDLKVQFAKDVLDKDKPGILDFHAAGWVAEVQTIFTVNGKDQPVILFMALEPDHLGYKWVISNVYSDIFSTYFKRDTTKIGQFLHPMSHELDFMNLRKAFMTVDSVAQFASKHFVPDYLTLFLYEVKKGTMKFRYVNDVKFHFFQIPGWYFELADFNRPRVQYWLADLEPC